MLYLSRPICSGYLILIRNLFPQIKDSYSLCPVDGIIHSEIFFEELMTRISKYKYLLKNYMCIAEWYLEPAGNNLRTERSFSELAGPGF